MQWKIGNMSGMFLQYSVLYGLFIHSTFIFQFVNNLLALLLCKINLIEIFNRDDFFSEFVASRNIEFLNDSTFTWGIYGREQALRFRTQIQDT